MDPKTKTTFLELIERRNLIANRQTENHLEVNQKYSVVTLDGCKILPPESPPKNFIEEL